MIARARVDAGEVRHLIRLVGIDVDRTLVGSAGSAPERVWRAAERARAAGIRLALCSGRPAFGVTGSFYLHAVCAGSILPRKNIDSVRMFCARFGKVARSCRRTGSFREAAVQEERPLLRQEEGADARIGA